MRINGLNFQCLCLLFVCPTVFACSGPGAAAAIATSEFWSVIIWFCTAAVALFSARWWGNPSLPWVRLVFLASIVSFHPGWTISARHGDCGALKFYSSLTFLGLAILFVLIPTKSRAP